MGSSQKTISLSVSILRRFLTTFSNIFYEGFSKSKVQRRRGGGRGKFLMGALATQIVTIAFDFSLRNNSLILWVINSIPELILLCFWKQMFRMAVLNKIPVKGEVISVIRFCHAKGKRHRNSQTNCFCLWQHYEPTKRNETAFWMQKKRRGILTSGMWLLHDNAPSHAGLRTKILLKKFNWEVLYDGKWFLLENHLKNRKKSVNLLIVYKKRKNYI